MQHYSDEEVEMKFFCRLCDTEMREESDINYPDKKWLHCPECSKDIDKIGMLETRLISCCERLVEARTLYNDLQDQIKRMIR